MKFKFDIKLSEFTTLWELWWGMTWRIIVAFFAFMLGMGIGGWIFKGLSFL